MRTPLCGSLANRAAWVCAVIALILVLPRSAMAPPAGGGAKAPRKPAAPKKPPAARPAGKKPPAKHPAGPPKRVGRKPGAPTKRPAKVHRYVRRYHYWHPLYRVAPRVTEWRHIGYPYYVGGTNYVVLPQETSSDVSSSETLIVAPSAAESESAVTEVYVQLQELTELIYEWRTLNESPTFLQRLTASEGQTSDPSVVNGIRELNQRFDQVTRAAMLKLAGGESAESELDAARRCWERLLELVEQLPESS
jgi:hypothetical protein